MKLLNSIYIKIVSWILVVSFIFVFVFKDYTYARVYISGKADFVHPQVIDIPFEYGQVVERYEPRSSHPLVILIQDLHANYEVQKNIKDILNYIDENYKISKIGVEGNPSATEIDTSIVSTIQDERIKVNVLNYFMRKGLVTGPEEFASLKKSPPPLVGIENEELYETDKNLLLSSLNHRPQIIEYLQRIKYLLKIIEDKMFSTEVKKFRAHFILYKQKKLSSYIFQKYLKQWAKEVNKSIGGISGEYAKYIVLTERQNSLDDREIEKEYRKLLGTLDLDYENESKVSITYKRFKNFFRTPESIQNKMTKIIYSDKSYSNLRRYIESVQLSREINTHKLLKAENKVIETIAYGLCRNETEKDLLFVMDYIQALIKFLLNQITRDELDEFYEKAEDFEKKFNSLISMHQKEILTIDSLLLTLKPYIDEMGNFYNIACKRDEEFVRNFVKRGKSDENLIMVTGGFHTKGIAKKLKEKKIPYAVITPRVTSHTEEVTRMYYELLMGKQFLSYDDLLVKLALKSFFFRKWFLKRIVVKAFALVIEELKEEGLREENIGKEFQEFFIKWVGKYNAEKKIKFAFNVEDVIDHQGEVLFFLNLNGEKLVTGLKNGKVRSVPQKEAETVAQDWFWRNVENKVGIIKEEPVLDELPIEVKAILAGIDPLGEIESSYAQLIRSKFKNLKLIEMENKYYIYDEALVIKILNSSDFAKDSGEFEKDLNKYLKKLIKSKDWKLNILKGYSKEVANAAREGRSVRIFQDEKGRSQAESITEEAKPLPKKTNEEAYKKLAALLIGEIAARPEVKRFNIRDFISRHRVFIGASIIGIGIVVSLLSTGLFIPAVVGSLASLTGLYLLTRERGPVRVSKITEIKKEVTEKVEVPASVVKEEVEVKEPVKVLAQGEGWKIESVTNEDKKMINEWFEFSKKNFDYPEIVFADGDLHWNNIIFNPTPKMKKDNAKVYKFVTTFEGKERIEGLMRYYEDGEEGEQFMYLSHIEIAPWNRGEKRQLKGIATKLMEALVKDSFAAEFGGRVMVDFDNFEDGVKFAERIKMMLEEDVSVRYRFTSELADEFLKSQEAREFKVVKGLSEEDEERGIETVLQEAVDKGDIEQLDTTLYTKLGLNAAVVFKDEILKNLETLKSAGCEKIETVLVRGSVARGEARPDSDVDIVVVFSGEIDKVDYEKFRSVVGNIKEEVERQFDNRIEVSPQLIETFFIEEGRVRLDELPYVILMGDSYANEHISKEAEPGVPFIEEEVTEVVEEPKEHIVNRLKELRPEKRKIIYILAEAEKAISSKLLADFSGEDIGTVKEVLSEWKEFLVKGEIVKDTVSYAWKDDFKNLLHRREDVILELDISREDINGLIADPLWDELFPDINIADIGLKAANHRVLNTIVDLAYVKNLGKKYDENIEGQRVDILGDESIKNMYDLALKVYGVNDENSLFKKFNKDNKANNLEITKEDIKYLKEQYGYAGIRRNAIYVVGGAYNDALILHEAIELKLWQEKALELAGMDKDKDINWNELNLEKRSELRDILRKWISEHIEDARQLEKQYHQQANAKAKAKVDEQKEIVADSRAGEAAAGDGEEIKAEPRTLSERLADVIGNAGLALSDLRARIAKVPKKAEITQRGIIGIDIGGTKIMISVVEIDNEGNIGKVFETKKIKTEKMEPENFYKKLAEEIEEVKESVERGGIKVLPLVGIGSPGRFIEEGEKRIIAPMTAPNLGKKPEDFDRVSPGELVREALKAKGLDMRVYVNNDAIAQMGFGLADLMNKEEGKLLKGGKVAYIGPGTGLGGGFATISEDGNIEYLTDGQFFDMVIKRGIVKKFLVKGKEVEIKLGGMAEDVYSGRAVKEIMKKIDIALEEEIFGRLGERGGKLLSDILDGEIGDEEVKEVAWQLVRFLGLMQAEVIIKI